MSYIVKVPVSEARLEFFDYSGKKLSDVKGKGDIVRSWMFSLTGPNIDETKVRSVNVPVLDYSSVSNGQLFYEVEFFDESGYQKDINKDFVGNSEIDIGDFKIIFYSFKGYPYIIGKEDDDFVRPWMWQVESNWVPQLMIRKITFPKLSYLSKDSLKIDINFEMYAGEKELLGIYYDKNRGK